MASSAALPASAGVPVTGQGREFLLLKTAMDGPKTPGADLQSAVNGLGSLVEGNPLTTVAFLGALLTHSLHVRMHFLCVPRVFFNHPTGAPPPLRRAGNFLTELAGFGRAHRR